MVTERTYGVEIEMASKLNRSSLTAYINAAFDAAGIDHICRTSGYHHNTDGLNTRVWEVQSDGSIRTTSTHTYKVEIVSPVLRGQAGLDALKVVSLVANRYGKINSSCGLHVHHGVGSWEDVVNISRAYSSFQDVIYNGLPARRSESHYCKKWNAGSSLDTQITRASRNRYTGLNLCSYALRKTVEFRCAAGSTEFEKISNWILFTQGLVEAAIAGKDRPTSDIDGLVKFVAASTNEYQSIRGRNPSKRSKIAKALNALVNEGCHTKQSLMVRLVEMTGCAESSAYTYITDSLNDKYNNLKTKVVVEDGIYKFAADADYQQAATWFQGRYNHFQNAA